MTSMMNDVLIGAIMVTTLGDNRIISDMGSIMGSIRATAAELDIMLERNHPKKPMP